jgi:phthiocerol/phthiodiolone dimycocerosyl transferase-like enzyme
MSPEPTERRLSPLERWYWVADQVSPLNVISRVRLTGPLPLHRLRAALDAVQARHPLLRTAIAGDTAPRFVPTDRPIPLRVVPADGTDEQWVREVDERELADRIDWRTGPLCRAVVLTTGPGGDTHDLLLTLPHCVADGTTVLALLADWLTTAAGGTAPAHPMPRAVEDLVPRRYRGPWGAARLGGQLLADLYRIRRYRPVRMVPSRFVPYARRRTRLIHRGLPAEQVAALAAACRREGTTVNGALAAAMVMAVGGEPGAPVSSRVAIGSPIDVRGDLVPPVPADAAGAYVATVPSFVPYRPGQHGAGRHGAGGSLWAVARAVSTDLAGRRARGNPFAMVALTGWSGPKSAATGGRFLDRVESSGPVNLCLSNLGRYDFPDTLGPWRLSGAQFVAGLSVCGYFVATVNTSHGQLAWNFEYVADAVPAARATALADACLHAVRDAIGRSADDRQPA